MRKGRISLLDEMFMTTTLKVIAEDLKARLPIRSRPIGRRGQLHSPWCWYLSLS
jgi:hypothetical protein